MSVTTPGQRLIFANARRMLISQGLSVKDAVLTQSYLRLEVAATISNNQWTFNPLQNQATQFNTEQRLTLQDSFVVGEAGVFWYVPSSATATDTPLRSWPNPNIFTVANSATSANGLYHSTLKLEINKKVVVPAWDTWRSYAANQTQLTGAANSPVDQLSGRDDVFYATEPNWVIIGSRNTIPTIVMPNAFTAIQTNARIVLFLRGVLAQNSTSVQ